MQKHKIHIIFRIKSLLSSNLSLVDANPHTSILLSPNKMAAFSFFLTSVHVTNPNAHQFHVTNRTHFCSISTQWVHNSRLWLLFEQITKGGGAKCSLYRRKRGVQVNERSSWSWMRETQTKSLTSGKKPLFHHAVVLFTAFCFYWIFKPDSLIYPGLKEKNRS